MQGKCDVKRGLEVIGRFYQLILSTSLSLFSMSQIFRDFYSSILICGQVHNKAKFRFAAQRVEILREGREAHWLKGIREVHGELFYLFSFSTKRRITLQKTQNVGSFLFFFTFLKLLLGC
jgi:hypothetical protein